MPKKTTPPPAPAPKKGPPVPKSAPCIACQGTKKNSKGEPCPICAKQGEVPLVTPVTAGPAPIFDSKTASHSMLRKGYALALHDLAVEKGMSVQAVAEMPEALASVGLPAKMDPATCLLAHEIYRNGVDAMLWRNNCCWRCNGHKIGEKAPELSREQAEAVIASPRPAQKMEAAIVKAETGESKKVGTARGMIFGYSATAVARWLGKQGASLEQVKKIMERQGIDLNPNTLAIQVRAGAKGERGEPAPLTAAQGAVLMRFERAEEAKAVEEAQEPAKAPSPAKPPQAKAAPKPKAPVIAQPEKAKARPKAIKRK